MISRSRIPESLDRYLLTSSDEKSVSISTFVERGSPLITPEAVDALRSILPALRSKIDLLEDSPLLKRRIEILRIYFEEAVAAQPAPDAVSRDVTFALFYFLKGYDRIPDSLPEIGLLDDTIVVNTVLQWHQAALRLNWIRRGRSWPADV